MWEILGITAIIILVVYFFKGQNAVWGTFTLAVIIGLVIAFFFNENFEWRYVAKAGIIGALLGYMIEQLGILSDIVSKHQKNPKE